MSDQPHVRVLPDVFELGLRISTNERYLGHRPLVSKNPLKFADHYVWETYAQVDQRRRNIGSALHKYFTDDLLGGGEMPTVGIWSINRPGSCAHEASAESFDLLFYSFQSGKSSTWRYRRTQKSVSAYTTLLARTQLVMSFLMFDLNLALIFCLEYM